MSIFNHVNMHISVLDVSILIDPSFLPFCGAFNLEVLPYDRLLICLSLCEMVNIIFSFEKNSFEYYCSI